MASTPKLRESALELEILIYLSRLGIGFFWKNVSSGYHDGKRFRKHANPFAIRGVADIVGIVGGRFVAFEVKTLEGDTSEFQDAWIKKAREHGALACVVRSVGDVEEQLRSWGLIP